MFIDQKTSKMANLPLLIYRQKTIPIEINKPILKSTWNAKDLSSQKSEKQRWKTYTVWLKLFSSSPLPFPLTHTHSLIIFDKGVQVIQWGKKSSQEMMLKWLSIWKKKKTE